MGLTISVRNGVGVGESVGVVGEATVPVAVGEKSGVSVEVGGNVGVGVPVEVWENALLGVSEGAGEDVAV